VSFLEVKKRYDGSVAEYECELLHYSPEKVILFYEMPESRIVDEVTLPKGAYTIAYYWADRDYNAYHWVLPSGETLAFYFNMVEGTVLRPDTLTYRDMIVDVICYEDGKTRVLDEEELQVPLDEFEGGKVKASIEGLFRDLDKTLQELSKETRKFLRVLG
jgi:predicted RNA-binding protein associated with RNAse of E/G family